MTPRLFRYRHLSAAALLLFAPAIPALAQGGIGLRGEYFNSIDLSGQPSVNRTDTRVDFEWSGRPAREIEPDSFSVRWTGKVLAPTTGSYTFTTVSNNGVRLWVNGAKVIDHWTRHSTATDKSDAIALTAGQKYDIKMEFFENQGNAVAKLQWSYAGKAAAAIPQSQLFPPATTYLSDLQWTSATNGLGPVERDMSNGKGAAKDGTPLSINDVSFAKGLGTRAPGNIRYNLAGNYDVFTTFIGIDDDTRSSQGSAKFEVWLDGTLAYRSDTLRGRDEARFVRLIVTGKKEMALVVTAAGDNGSEDNADWADAQLAKVAIAADPYLSDLEWTSATNGWGPVERDRSNGEQSPGDGAPLSINGTKYAKGLGVHAPSDVRFRLNGQYGTFVSWIGIDDEVASTKGSSIFQVWLDGVKAFQSPEMTGKSPAQKVTVNVAGKNELRLVVTAASGGSSYDHADWAGAQLFKGTPAPAPSAPPAPTNPKATGGGTQITLSWTASSGAASYNIYRGTSAGGESATPIATGITATTYNNTNLSKGTTYFYKIAGVNAGGVGALSAEVSATTDPAAPAAPKNLDADGQDKKILLTWTASPGVASYNIYRGTAAGGESATPIAAGITATTYTNTGLTNGTKYFYKVAAVNSGGISAMSNEASAEPVPPAPGAPTNLTATSGNEKITLNWNAVAGATSYKIYRGTAAGAEGTNPIGSATSTTYTNTGLTNGTKYFYKVAAVNAGGIGAQSNEASSTPQDPPPPAPSSFKAAPGDTRITLTWQAAAGAATYNLYRGTSAGGEGSTPYKTGLTGATYADTGLTNGVALFYKIAGVNGGGAGALSSEVTATPVPLTPAAPTGLTATPGNKQITLSWTATPGATSYNVYRGATSNGQSTTPFATGLTNPTFTDTGLPNGPAVYYKVAAVNLGGVSPKSNEASASPVGPPAVPPVGLISASRLLRQSTWGPTPALVDRVMQGGANAFLEEQFNAQMSDYPDTLKTAGSIEPLAERFFQNAITGHDQLRQRVAFALSQIFVVSGVKVSNPKAMVPYQKMLLTGAFGNFSDLLRNVTLSPAMGEFLDMVNNRKADPTRGLSPNENYAREVLQLFTIGLTMLNPDGTPQSAATFDQSTVAELARVFTGWTYGDNKAGQPTGQNPAYYDGPMEAVEKYHDTGAKTILGKSIPANLTTTDDLEAALRIIFEHQNVAPFISKQLIQHLVTSNPSSGYVQRVAAVFANNGAGVRGDLRAVVKAILLDPEAALGQPTSGHLREPALFLTSLLRALNAQIADHPFVSDKSEEMSQRIFYAPSVFNYFSPGFRTSAGLLGPEFQIFTTATSLVRINFVSTLLSNGFGADVTLDLAPYLADLPDTGALLDRVNFNFMGGLMSQQMRDAILTAVAKASSNNEKVRTAIYLAVTSSQYQVEN